MNQSEARLHSGRSVHFHPSLSPRPSFRFYEGLVPRLRLRDGTVTVDTDKYRLVGIPPSGRESPDVGLTRIC